MDNQNTIALLQERHPAAAAQYYAYLEVGHAKDDGGGEASSLWRAYEHGGGSDERMAMRAGRLRRWKPSYPVFLRSCSRG